MYYNDHAPPHFHVRYGEHRALVGIDQIVLLAGTLPRRALSMVLEWAALHQSELREDWRTARMLEPLKRIDPLE